ncbi:MAG: hypothetical protein IKB42_02765 [Clostridia bacterium]|nr:hypothetical protein [Clostridia bacterium]
MKKLFSYVFALLLSVTMFAGCNLFELNASKYYSQTVAQIVYDNNNKYDFTMEDLLQAYNNYGYQLAQNDQEMTGEEVLKQTAELMVQRKLLVEQIKKEISLTTEEKNVLKRQVYENINSTLASYEAEIRVEWDRDIKEEASTEETPATTVTRAEYTPYEPTVEKQYYEEVVNGSAQLKYKLVAVEKEEEQQDTTDPGEFVQATTDEDISAEAWKRYIADLQKNNEELGKSYTDEKAFEKEIARIYGILEENKYISKYQEVVEDGLEIVSQAAVDSYKEKYKRDYELYSGKDGEAAYHKAMASDASTVYYHPNSGNEYVYVTHILFKFSDAQTAEIERLEKLYKSNSITKEVYDARIAEVKDIDNTVVTYLDNGVEKKTNATLAYQDILNNVNKYDAEIQFEQRAKAFNTMLYRYNDDEGIMNKDFGYVVNLDTNVQDQMVKPFADEARRLHNKEGLGAISEPILTDYGYHVIMNLGPVRNVVEYGNIENLTWEALYNIKTQPSSEKTLFHVEYDAINTNSTKVTEILNSKVADLSAGVEKIRYWEKRFLTLLEEKK